MPTALCVFPRIIWRDFGSRLGIVISSPPLSLDLGGNLASPFEARQTESISGATWVVPPADTASLGRGEVVALEYSHNPWLIAASFAIALMAGFTGLSMARGLSRFPPNQRKARVAMAAIVLGGGIWSMHFVAMLGLQLPIPFFYDALITLISALLAILVVGIALIVLHFRRRTPVTITAAGLFLGTGILAMHYTGMAGMQACRAHTRRAASFCR